MRGAQRKREREKEVSEREKKSAFADTYTPSVRAPGKSCLLANSRMGLPITRGSLAICSHHINTGECGEGGRGGGSRNERYLCKHISHETDVLHIR
jgi:hypothetical protein